MIKLSDYEVKRLYTDKNYIGRIGRNMTIGHRRCTQS